MSLIALRDMRLRGMRPAAVALVTRDCPKPWPWLHDDPAIVWLPQRADVRAHDLRPLVGLSVTALVDDVKRRTEEVMQAVQDARGVLVGIADGQRAIVLDAHPWSPLAQYDDEWRDLAGRELTVRQQLFWSM